MNLLRRAGAWLRARLIDDAHRAWRFASVRIAALGFLFELLLQFDVLDRLMPTRPAQFVSLALFGLVVLGRVAKKADADV